MIGSCCGRAQANTSASGTTSSSSPWMTIVSAAPCSHREAVDRGADQHQALGVDALRDARLHERAERESGERDAAALAEARARVRERRERVVGLADAVVERARRTADAAEIEAHRGVAQRDERLGERLHDLVVERAALLRMRMRDERDARAASPPAR